MGIHIMPPLYEKVIKPQLKRFEYCHAVGEELSVSYYTTWYQSFIPTVSHTLTRVVLLLGKGQQNWPGDFIGFGFREAEADGKPKGASLFDKLLPWDDLAPYGSLAKVIINIDPLVPLTKDQPYCWGLEWGPGSGLGSKAQISYDSDLVCGLALWLDYTFPPVGWYAYNGSLWFEEWGM